MTFFYKLVSEIHLSLHKEQLHTRTSFSLVLELLFVDDGYSVVLRLHAFPIL